MAAIGIEIIGGGRNKFTRTSVNVEGEDSKGIVLDKTEDNEFEDVVIFAGSSLQRIRDMQTDIFKIEDESINDKTKNTFKNDILSKLPTLTNLSKAVIKQSALKEIRSTLADWITILGTIAPPLIVMLMPYLEFLNQFQG